jgi:aryl-alcohol dehydrogenase-like predicted oxidoreductase
VTEGRSLGRSGIEVCRLCLGGNVFGGNADERASFEVLDTYLELGGNFIDSADVYSKWIPGHRGGESETVIGKWMKSRGVRDRVVVATKVGSAMGPGPQNKGLHRAHVERALKASLKRLQVETIDIYYAHQDDPETPLEEALGHFDELVRAGQVRALGASNYPADRLREALTLQETRGWARYEVAQPAYSLMNRLALEGAVAAVCREFGLAVFGFAALAGGFLTGKYRRDADLPDSKRARSVASRYIDERGWRVVEAVLEVARERGNTPAQVALAWVLAKPDVSGPIAAAMSAEQMRELWKALEVHLSEAEVKTLDEASAP